MSDQLVIVLAAGKGTRMRSALPKVLHEIANRSLLEHVIVAASELPGTRQAIVVGPDVEAAVRVASQAAPQASVHVQHERLGTGHAVMAAREAIAPDDNVLVVFGDTPLISPQTLAGMRARLADGADVVVLGFEPADPTGYGRLLTRGDDLLAIREHKDATDDERQIVLCNGGAMAFGPGVLNPLLDKLTNDNAAGEYYLTDAVELANAEGFSVAVVRGEIEDAIGVNTPADLHEVGRMMQTRLRHRAVEAGAVLVAPDTVQLSADTVLGEGARVEPYVVFGPKVTVGPGASVHSFSHLEDARVGRGASVGPYARLRPGAELGAGAKVGNFVEIKKARLGEGAKVNHLSYVGDADVGAASNLGAGTVTCNYDGYLKHRTTIGRDVFVGSGSLLVAPVTLGDGALTGSGSVITQDVPADALALGRSRQVNLPGRAKRLRATLQAAKERLRKG